jgi:microcystin-dependent protein
MFGGNFAPAGWALCDGRLLPISEYETLFVLLGTTYGGDGQSTFAVPDLRGRLPVHQGGGLLLGQAGGSEKVTLTSSQRPLHSHSFLGSVNPGAQRNPTGNVPATIPAGSAYVQGPATTALAAQSIQSDPGGGQPHDNMQPYLCVTFIISLFGVFPVPELRGARWTRFSPRSEFSGATSPPRGGRSATAS